MTTFTSNSFNIDASAADLSALLSAPQQLVNILPHDRIENVVVEDNRCSFTIKGLARITLKLKESGTEKVVYESEEAKPFPFMLTIHLRESNPTQLSASIDADVNSFMSMMLEKPLVNFLNLMGESIMKLYPRA